jgi:hypothetical protein
MGCRSREIGQGAFYKRGIQSVEFPSSIRIIADSAFAYNEIERVVLKDGLLYIDEFAFGENSIVDLELPASLKSIEQYAFDGNRLTSLFIPKVKVIQWLAFSNNPLNKIEFEGDTFVHNGAFGEAKIDFFSVIGDHIVIEEGSGSIGLYGKNLYKDYADVRGRIGKGYYFPLVNGWFKNDVLEPPLELGHPPFSCIDGTNQGDWDRFMLNYFFSVLGEPIKAEADQWFRSLVSVPIQTDYSDLESYPGDVPWNRQTSIRGVEVDSVITPFNSGRINPVELKGDDDGNMDTNLDRFRFALSDNRACTETETLRDFLLFTTEEDKNHEGKALDVKKRSTWVVESDNHRIFRLEEDDLVQCNSNVDENFGVSVHPTSLSGRYWIEVRGFKEDSDSDLFLRNHMNYNCELETNSNLVCDDGFIRIYSEFVGFDPKKPDKINLTFEINDGQNWVVPSLEKPFPSEEWALKGKNTIVFNCSYE